MEPNNSFSYLRSKLTEWKAGDLLQPTAELTWKRFQEVAINVIQPVLKELQAVLESEGLEVSITELEEETQSLGFYVSSHSAALFFEPVDDALSVRFIARRLTGPEHGYEARLLSRKMNRPGVRMLVEEGLLRILGPRGSHT